MSINADKLSGIFTWAVVTIISLFLLWERESTSMTAWTAAAILHIAYIAIWLYMTSEGSSNTNKSNQPASMSTRTTIGICVLVCIVVSLYFLVPYSFTSILMGVMCGIIAYYSPNKLGLFLVILCSLPLYFIQAFYWEFHGAFITAMLFCTFNIFAFIMIRSNVKEQLARERAELINRKLVSTQSLLEEAVKQGERVRIARNIHDLVGHHLTALSIHLQVASRQTEGETQKTIQDCHQLAKLLLSDVREAVSDIRDKSDIDLEQMLQKLAQTVPFCSVKWEIEDSVKVTDIEVADTLIKCIQESITNALKHSGSKSINIVIKQRDTQLDLIISNPDVSDKAIVEGNGLRGMKERVQALKGTVDFVIDNQRFVTTAMIPINAAS